MLEDISRRYRTAVSLAYQAGRRAQAYRSQGLEISEKGSQDFVTQADKGVEALIRGVLAEAFPEDGFLGEEDGLTEGGAGTWVVDPIDGTTNFASGSDFWCVSIAWVRDGAVRAGAVFAPDREEMFSAWENGGAYLNGRPLSKLRPQPASRSLVCVGRSPKTPPNEHAGVIAALLEGGYEYRRFGAGALCTAHVATGYVQAFFERRINSWDVLAALLIARETGAWCSDFLADGGLLNGNPVLACVPGLEVDLLERLEMSHLNVMAVAAN